MTEQSRRDAILASAAALFAERGVGATTVREIGDSVGVLSGSLYHHFASKDEMVDEILGRYLDALRAAYAEVVERDLGATRALRELIAASVRIAEEHPHATAIYQNELHHLREVPRFKHVRTASSDIQRTWLRVIEAGVASGELRGDIEPRVFYRLLRDALWLSARWHRPTAAYPSSRLAADITAVFLEGFTVPARRGRR